MHQVLKVFIEFDLLAITMWCCARLLLFSFFAFAITRHQHYNQSIITSNSFVHDTQRFHIGHSFEMIQCGQKRECNFTHHTINYEQFKCKSKRSIVFDCQWNLCWMVGCSVRIHCTVILTFAWNQTNKIGFSKYPMWIAPKYDIIETKTITYLLPFGQYFLVVVVGSSAALKWKKSVLKIMKTSAYFTWDQYLLDLCPSW